MFDELGIVVADKLEEFKNGGLDVEFTQPNEFRCFGGNVFFEGAFKVIQILSIGI